MGLSATKVKSNLPQGRYLDDRGLYLIVKPSGRKSWVYRYQLHGRRRDAGLGSFPEIGLAEARDKHFSLRRQVLAGIDPLGSAKARRVPSFEVLALEYIDKEKHSWRNAKHAQQWTNTLTTYAFPVIGSIPIDQVSADHIMSILKPIWLEKNETARRVRSRMENILDFATAHNLRGGENPARWKGHLAILLPKHKPKVVHHAAMPYSEVPAFMAKLKDRAALSARALEFLIHTASRVGEVRGATWSEIDLDKKVWTIPPERYKTGKEHQVPLTEQSIRMINSLPKLSEYLFGDKPLSNMAMSALMKRMEVSATAHGFRSCFRDWSAETTTFDNHICEMALGHSIGNAVEAAYRRGSLLQKRTELMASWSDYLT